MGFVMGEKLLAQRALMLLRDTYGKSSREAEAAVQWAQDTRDWLWPDRAWAEGEVIDWGSLASLAAAIETSDPLPEMFGTMATALDLLELDAFDRDLVVTVTAFDRLPRLSQLGSRLAATGCDLLSFMGQLAGASATGAEGKVRRSKTLELDLLYIERRDGGGAEIRLCWSFGDLIDRAAADQEKIIGALAGKLQSPSLERADFVEYEKEMDLLVRLLSGALQTSAKGVSVLIYGPPGTGKTEFARTLAAEAGARLFAVGEADDDGDEPTRHQRLSSLNRALRVLARGKDSLVLFDELEDLFAEADTVSFGQRRAGSKIFVNRLLEELTVPVIWTSNSISGIDPAHLRRMSYVLRMGYPAAAARERIAARSAEAAGSVEAVEGLKPFLLSELDSASVAPVALRTAALAGGGAADAAAAEDSLLRGLRGGRRLAPARWSGELDLSLYDADICIAEMVGQITRGDAPADFSLLLSGPPGTGKTALAADVARRLDRPLAVKRASDLLSMWVGGTEAKIAEAFAGAREEGAVLLFDEADSLLLDRSDAKQSWEITQVNELLTWMDNHPLPFIAATNFARRLDPAVFRRFLFKVELRPLSGAKLELAFERFFECPAPVVLHEINGLTPGDFAVVKRQLRYQPACSGWEIVDLLRREAETKPEASGRIGF